MKLRTLLFENGLSIVVFTIFFLCLLGQWLSGWAEYNKFQVEHYLPVVGCWTYLFSGHFIEAVFENWESEFLQMGLYVLLTAFFYQRGSAESKKLGSRKEKLAPGLSNWLYAHSLTIVLLLLFAISFVLHAVGGAKDLNAENAAHGIDGRFTTLEYIGTSRFWFESFQNWQSEFLSIGALVVLSIFLRQVNSPESKKVSAPNDEEGG